MNPRDELRSLIARLRADLAAIVQTPRNRLRIADRNRELARCTSLLAKLEDQAAPAEKARSVPSAKVEEPFDPRTMFPNPNDDADDDPDLFLGLAGEDALIVFPDEPLDPDRLEHALSDPFVPTAQLTVDELKAVERRLAGWFDMPGDAAD